jgi:hypothetical protein
MHPRSVAFAVLGFLYSTMLSAQITIAPPPSVFRDAQAVAIVQQSIAIMANNIPSDSSASGSVAIVEGSAPQSGTIQILTRGTAQTAEAITLPTTQRAVIYSNGNALEVSGGQSINPPLESVVTDQGPDFPLPFFLGLLNNTDEAFVYVGQETLNGMTVQHIQLWNTFASNPHLEQLAPFSTRDIWFSSANGLPLKIAYTRRAGGGAMPSFPVEVTFANYTNVSGVLYPFQISKSYNGTPWEAIAIQTVAFNTGLTDAQFQVQ